MVDEKNLSTHFNIFDYEPMTLSGFNLMGATQDEKAYRWLEAAKLYEQESGSSSESGVVAAECWQKIGLCYDLASRQARNAEDFKKLKQMAVEAYEKAADFFSKESTTEQEGKKEACLAIAEYLRSWLASDPSEKVQTLDKCRALAKKAMQALKTSGNDLFHGQISNILTTCLYERSHAESNGKKKNEIALEGMENANDAVRVLSKLDNKEELLLAFSLASIQAWYVSNLTENEADRKKIADKSMNYAESAIALSKDVDNPYAKAMSSYAAVWSNLYFAEDSDVSLKYAKEMLEQASIVQDNYLRGVASYLLADVTDMKVLGETNPDKRKQQYEEIIKYSEGSIRYLSLVFQNSFLADACLLLAQTYSTFASDFALCLAEKLTNSKKAVEIGKDGIEYAIHSGSPEAMISTLHGLSKAYHYHSTLEPGRDSRQKLLREALNYRNEYVRIAKESFPSNSWVLGVGEVYAAQIETELSRLERNESGRIALLREATSRMEDGVFSCKKWISSDATPSFVASLAGYEDSFGGVLDEGYLLTTENADLTKANKAYVDAAEDFKKVDLPSRVAESYWKIARNLDRVGNYDQAANNFENAFAAYKAAAQKTSQFSDFYFEYAYYMKAWSEIEFAKGAHNEEKYEVAMRHYEKASQLLRQSQSWMYLSSNFYAWSLLEQAEDLSRKEKCKESIEAFEEAVKSLKDSKRVLSMKLEGIDRIDEKDLVQRLIQVSDTREEYSLGRIAIEEARVLHKQGDNMASSDKYDKAAAIFQKMSLADSEQTGKEAKTLACLCKAWQKMTLAEARSSPIMYEEAAELFKLAREHMSKESSGLMALGHSSFCKALEAGTEFEITRTMAMYEETVRHLEAAAEYYLRAGFETTSDYARATQRLFDAYVFIGSAKQEREPGKQAKYYSMAEKVLEAAAEYFEKADYQSKTEEAQRFLRKVREEKELAISLSAIFHAPVITASTASLSAIGPREENAVGLKRFEHADIQAKLVQHETETKVGSTVALEIQIMNIGKEPVSLARIENLVPAGFQLLGKPDYCQFENMQLTMKGKKLDPLKSDEMKITLRSFKKGTIEIKPRIVCSDQTGQQLLCSPEPCVFNVSDAKLPGRVPTGFADLDNLLLGGIPENYAVILASSSSDEREQLVRKFLETGIRNGQATFLITTEVRNIANLAEQYQSNFYSFVCNPRAEVMIPNLPNVFKLKGVENLTDISIALTKALQTLDEKRSGVGRACITIISDVLLQHHAMITRKWLSGLLPDLKSKGFTTLALIDPDMHSAEEVQAILDIFEGEIRISEKETDKGSEKTLRVRKLYNQRYLENELVLTREKLESSD